jgi:hypothetical protein
LLIAYYVGLRYTLCYYKLVGSNFFLIGWLIFMFLWCWTLVTNPTLSTRQRWRAIFVSSKFSKVSSRHGGLWSEVNRVQGMMVLMGRLLWTQKESSMGLGIGKPTPSPLCGWHLYNVSLFLSSISLFPPSKPTHIKIVHCNTSIMMATD